MNERHTRREMLAALAAVPLVAGAKALDAQAQQPPSPPGRVIITNDAPVKAVVTPKDLKFKGYIRPSNAGTGDMWSSSGTLSLRRVGGQLRAFMFGNSVQELPIWPTLPVYEFALPDNPNTDLRSAPFAPLLKDWGPLLKGRTLTGGNGEFYPGGTYWDQENNAIWWSYGDSYVPVQSHPTIGCSILNDKDGTATSYGPWRTQWSSQRTRGAFCPIPEKFAAAYTSGQRAGVMASQASGNVNSPFGAILSTMQLPDPRKTPADVTTNENWTIANHGLILHDLDHRQARDTRFKSCGWTVPYDCREGGPINPGLGIFGGSSPVAGENDTMKAAAWIDLPDKHGLIYFGQLATTPEGYTAPGDPDGYIHMWYGAPFRADGTPPLTCCHGQDDPWWQATGPGCHYRVPMAWIYNPNDLIATAKGGADLWSRVPTSTFQMKPTIMPQLKDRYQSGFFAGAAFDAESRRLYVVLYDDWVTNPPRNRPVILVFDIA